MWTIIIIGFGHKSSYVDIILSLLLIMWTIIPTGCGHKFSYVDIILSLLLIMWTINTVIMTKVWTLFQLCDFDANKP